MWMKERGPIFDLQQRKIHLCMGSTKEERNSAWICFQPKGKKIENEIMGLGSIKRKIYHSGV